MPGVIEPGQNQTSEFNENGIEMCPCSLDCGMTLREVAEQYAKYYGCDYDEAIRQIRSVNWC